MNKFINIISGERFLFYALPVFLYMFLVFVLSSISHYPDIFPWVFSLDKFVHTIEYYVLGYLLMRMFVTSPRDIFSRVPIVFVIIFGVLYGISDEWHQSFVPGRYASIYDILFDIFGILLAVATYRFVRRRVVLVKIIEDMIEGV